MASDVRGEDVGAIGQDARLDQRWLDDQALELGQVGVEQGPAMCGMSSTGMSVATELPTAVSRAGRLSQPGARPHLVGHGRDDQLLAVGAGVVVVSRALSGTGEGEGGVAVHVVRSRLDVEPDDAVVLVHVAPVVDGRVTVTSTPPTASIAWVKPRKSTAPM